MNKDAELEYNSQREKLIIPEYGRNVQKLINHARAIEDPELRQAFVERVVDLMMQMHPQNRNIDDYREKLWKHAFRIGRYEISVKPPNGIIPTQEDEMKRPEKVDYPQKEARYRHYGHNVQKLIKKALSMEPGPIRDGFVSVIGSYMKLAYRTWNKEHYVSDEIIKNDLSTLSNGALTLSDDTSLDNLSNANRRRKRSNDSRNNGHHHHKGRHKGRRKKN